MNYGDTIEYQKALRQFAKIDEWHCPHAITLTLKQGISVAGETCASFVTLTRDAASQNYRHFLNVLNGRIFGKAAKRGKWPQHDGHRTLQGT